MNNTNLIIDTNVTTKTGVAPASPSLKSASVSGASTPSANEPVTDTFVQTGAPKKSKFSASLPSISLAPAIANTKSFANAAGSSISSGLASVKAALLGAAGVVGGLLTSAYGSVKSALIGAKDSVAALFSKPATTTVDATPAADAISEIKEPEADATVTTASAAA